MQDAGSYRMDLDTLFHRVVPILTDISIYIDKNNFLIAGYGILTDGLKQAYFPFYIFIPLPLIIISQHHPDERSPFLHHKTIK
ncbi:MAG: hypothetical protein ACFFCS_08830 [Candidatus Hodarchaeota archaeon]